MFPLSHADQNTLTPHIGNSPSNTDQRASRLWASHRQMARRWANRYESPPATECL